MNVNLIHAAGLLIYLGAVHTSVDFALILI